jgi:hypothetical protein
LLNVFFLGSGVERYLIQGVHRILTSSKKYNYAFKKVIVAAWNLHTVIPQDEHAGEIKGNPLSAAFAWEGQLLRLFSSTTSATVP